MGNLFDSQSSQLYMLIRYAEKNKGHSFERPLQDIENIQDYSWIAFLPDLAITSVSTFFGA